MSIRMSISVDESLIREVTRFFRSSSKAEAIRLALEHAVRHMRLEQALAHAGKLEIDLDQAGLEEHRSRS